MKAVKEIKKAKMNLVNSDCGNQRIRIIARMMPGICFENHSNDKIISETKVFCTITGKRI
jgi:hypothetical protein